MLSNHLIFSAPFSLCLPSFPASGSFPMRQLFTSGGQSIGASASINLFSYLLVIVTNCVQVSVWMLFSVLWDDCLGMEAPGLTIHLLHMVPNFMTVRLPIFWLYDDAEVMVFSRNCTSNFEWWSFPECWYGINSLSRNAGKTWSSRLAPWSWG